MVMRPALLLMMALAFIVLQSASVRAQVTGDLPNYGLDRGSQNFFGLPTGGRVQRVEDYEAERQYREALQRIPDRKPATRDPWGNVRQTTRPAATRAAPQPPYDRHRVY